MTAVGKVIIVIDIIRDTGTRIEDLRFASAYLSKRPQGQKVTRLAWAHADYDEILRNMVMIRVSKVGAGGELDDGLATIMHDVAHLAGSA
jgi:hypothetical protein